MSNKHKIDNLEYCILEYSVHISDGDKFQELFLELGLQFGELSVAYTDTSYLAIKLRIYKEEDRILTKLILENCKSFKHDIILVSEYKKGTMNGY